MGGRTLDGNYAFIYFLICQRLSNDDVGVARGTVSQEIRPGAGFKTGDFVEEMLGGATVVRLWDVGVSI